MSAVCAPAASPYRHRDPEETALHRVVRDHLNTFVDTHDVPGYVRRALRKYLDCGVLVKGVAPG